jgi:hypothetical protein
MFIRFKLKQGFCHVQVAKWMESHFGDPCDEGKNKTWFWDHGEIFERQNQYGQCEYYTGPKGIRIWKKCPETALAILKWGS